MELTSFKYPNQGVDCPECPEGSLNDQMDPLFDKMEKDYVEMDKQVVVGICAMTKKSNSKPMKEILARLDEFDYIKTIIFPEETILKVCFEIFPATNHCNGKHPQSLFHVGTSGEMANM